MKARRLVALAALALAGTAVPIAGGTPPAAAQGPAPAYKLVDLGTLGGPTTPSGIADDGTVVGRSEVATSMGPLPAAFRHTGTGPIEDLDPHLGFNLGSAAHDTALHPGGRWTVGDARFGPPFATYIQAFRMDGDTVEWLGSLTGGNGPGSITSATAVNSAGLAVGRSYNGQTTHGFMQDSSPGSEPIDLDPENPRRYSTATDVNDEGLIVGYAQKGERYTYVRPGIGTGTEQREVLIPMVSRGGEAFQELLPIPGKSAEPRAVNDAGAIVGYTVGPGATPNSHRAFLYEPGSGGRGLPRVRHLEGIPAAMHSEANDINDSNVIVGSSTHPFTGNVAVVFTPGRPATDLNAITRGAEDWTLLEATAVNDAGQIAGRGYKNGQLRAFRLDPATTTISVPPALSPLVGLLRNTLRI